jgi:transcriptional regulator with XRE-family HTH domain
MPTETASLPKPTSEGSQNTSSVWEELLHNFKTGKEYRHAFVEEKVRTSIAIQIKTMREQRPWTQPEFAKEMGKSQSWVSRLEDPNQSPPTIPSLLKVAESFDVDLEIRFSPFSELLRRLDATTPESFEVPSFGEELKNGAFEQNSQHYLDESDVEKAQTRRIPALHDRRVIHGTVNLQHSHRTVGLKSMLADGQTVTLEPISYTYLAPLKKMSLAKSGEVIIAAGSLVTVSEISEISIPPIRESLTVHNVAEIHVENVAAAGGL